jgi:hypothetical protein
MRQRHHRFSFAGMPLRYRGSSGFRGVRAWPNGTYYTKLHAGGFRLMLGTYDMPELAARAYDVAAWHFRCPRRDLNFPDMQSVEEVEFLSPPPRLLDDEDRHRHRQAQRRLAIVERDEELMHRWRAQFPSDVVDKQAFFNEQRAERRRDRRRRREIAEREFNNPNMTWGQDDPRWDNVWTGTSSDGE